VFNFQRGDYVPVGWNPQGGAGVVLNIKSHSLDISVLLFDTTNTGSGGFRSRLAGVGDAAGTVNADYDLDLSPYRAALITAGISGIANFYLSPTNFIQVPTIIEKVHYESAVESEVKYSFDVKGNSRAGLFVYPAL